MVLTPQGNLGNYFGVQSRDAWRREWLEIWSPAPWRLLGTHQWKIGTSNRIERPRIVQLPPHQYQRPARPTARENRLANQDPYKRNDWNYGLRAGSLVAKSQNFNRLRCSVRAPEACVQSPDCTRGRALPGRPFPTERLCSGLAMASFTITSRRMSMRSADTG